MKKKTPSDKDWEIARSLVHQVSKARLQAKSGHQSDVITLITAPMWRAFLRAVGEPLGSIPHQGLSVNGSMTIIVPGEEMMSVSKALR